MFVEFKRGNGMPWETDPNHVMDEDAATSLSAIGRNYELFGRLAGVRGGHYRDPLGLPEDVTRLVKEESERWGPDGHSHSYISLEEYKKVLFEELSYKPTSRDDAFYDYRSTPFEKQPPDFTTVVTYCDKLKERMSLDKILLGKDTTSEVQVRLVFWFDN